MPIRLPPATSASWIGALLVLLLAAGANGEGIPPPPIAAPPVGARHEAFAQLLAPGVLAHGVDYRALRADHADLDRFRAQLAVTKPDGDPDTLEGLLIDAYNAWTLALVERSLPADATGWSAWSIK